MDIQRFLPINEYNAAIGANSPGAGNVFATINDLSTVSNIYLSNGIVGSGRVLTLIDNITFQAGQFNIQGSGSTPATKSLSIKNSGSVEKFFVRDDGMVSATDGYSINGILFAHQPYSVLNTMVGRNTPTALTSINARNTGIGYDSLNDLTDGFFNTGIGAGTLDVMTVGRDNTAVGKGALGVLNTGVSGTESFNTAVGAGSLASLTTGTYNSALGYQAGTNLTGGTGCTLLGYSTGSSVSGSFNHSIALGRGAKFDSSNQMVVGNQSGGAQINQVVWGSGIEQTAINPTQFRMSITNITAGETDKDPDYDFVFEGARGTGTGDGGDIIFKTAPAGATGSTQNALVTILTVKAKAGVININNIPTSATGLVAGDIWSNGGVLTIV